MQEACVITHFRGRQAKATRPTRRRRSLRIRPSGYFGLGLLAVFLVLAILAPVITPYDPTSMHRGRELTGPAPEHWLGTDHLGRDILSRTLFGLRTSLLLSSLAVAVGGLFGTVIGIVAGYVGGFTETLIMRVTDILLPFPTVLLGIALAAALGIGVTSVTLAIAIVTFPNFARIARAATLAEREKEYVEAASALGAPAVSVMFRHILPNCSAPLLVQVSVALAAAIMVESGLSFLGLGTQPPTPSLGAMLDTARAYMRRAPTFAVFPGLTISLLLLSFNQVTDAIRDLGERNR